MCAYRIELQKISFITESDEVLTLQNKNGGQKAIGIMHCVFSICDCHNAICFFLRLGIHTSTKFLTLGIQWAATQYGIDNIINQRGFHDTINTQSQNNIHPLTTVSQLNL